jgi:DNA-binding CsgD family transcriptional regulator
MNLTKRDKEINRLRHEEGLRLRDIGDQYGISRERVRQICGNTGHLFSKRRKKSIRNASPNATNQELAERFDLSTRSISKYREGWHVVTGDSSPATGNAGEALVADLLATMGHEVELQGYGAPFDILLDGRVRIDVKAASAGGIPPSQVGELVNLRYNFSVRKFDNREPVDFYILITTDTDDVFVVPYKAVPDGAHNIQFCWPTARPSIGRYQKFLNRFDLLQGDVTWES